MVRDGEQLEARLQRIRHNHRTRKLNPDQQKRVTEVNEKIEQLAVDLIDLCPEGRELALALTNLEQVGFWSTASIAREV